MKLFTTIIIALLTFNTSLAQERTISGRLTSTEDGSALPGVNITIKGTKIGTTTDADGYYSLKVPIGATLVFAFVGMQSREVLVTQNNLQPVGSRDRHINVKQKDKKAFVTSIPRTLFQDFTIKSEIGIAFLTDDLPTYTNRDVGDPTTIRKLKHQGHRYAIKTDADPIRRTGLALQFSTSIGIERVNKLPSFQHQYAQGRTDGTNLKWNGADQLEIFTWGPLIRTLEFDGSYYPFDKNGKLVPAATGNAEAAKSYNTSFFRTGFINVNELMITTPTPRNGTLMLDFENRKRSGIIPNSQHKKSNLTASLKDFQINEEISASASIAFNRSTGDLLSRGANLTSIVGSIYRTPATFDNTNALSPNAAKNSKESYEFADGTKRSHAPGVTDNPYGLINDLPDNDKLDRLMANVNLQYSSDGPLDLVLNGSFDQQRNTTIFGTAPGYSGSPMGRLTERIDNQTFGNGIITTAYHGYGYYDGRLKLSLSYQADYSSRELERTDGFNFLGNESFGNINNADSIIILKGDLNRTTQELILNAQYEYKNWLNVRFTNRNYFSNTIDPNQYTNFFPTGSLSINLANLVSSLNIDYLKLYTSISRTIREGPLLYSNWSYGSSEMALENYAAFYEAKEIFFRENLMPETERKFETGLKIHSGRFSGELACFNNLTKDLIIPGKFSGGFGLNNAATIKNSGVNISAGYQGYIVNGSWGVELRWSTYNSMVEKIYSSEQWIALAGFNSLQTVLASDKPVGAIYGTTYVRNAEGKTVVDSDGFPLENKNLSMIGSPIPDWNLGWSMYARLRQFKVSFLLDFKKGGEVWNGTNSVLDYLGVSSTTENLRTTANYVFEGVHVNGNPNITPVDFYNPSNPISANRWVRYGWDGVGEDYIEDASWIRLSELALSYTTHQRWNNSTIKSIKFSLIGRNLFLITPYSGVDPSSTLFGYNTGNGIDLFNTPSTRSYSAQITIKI